MSRLRIAHLHSSLGIYGAERWTHALVKHLDDQEFESVIITIGAKPGADAFYHFVRKDGISAIHLPLDGRISIEGLKLLRSHIAELRIDVLHTHGFKADVLGFLATRNMNLKLVSTIHGWTPSEGRVIRAYEAISRIFLKRFDKLYPLSPKLLHQLQQQKFVPSKLQLILNGVDLTPFEINSCVRKKDEPIKFLFAGRICRPKGVFELMHAFVGANFSTPATLTIAGDGPDRSALESLAQALGVANRVRFLGTVESIAPYLKTSDVLVLPSHSEGIPRVVMEAFAAGVPVIGTAIAGIQELVEHEVTGFLVPVGDSLALARALERIIAMPELVKSMVTNAHQVVTTKYSASRMANDFRQEYRHLCSLE